MVFVGNCAAGESSIDEIGQRLFWPLRGREHIGVACFLYKVPIDAFLPTACGLCPQRLRLFTCRNIVAVPGIVQVSSWNTTEKEQVIWLGRRRQAKPQNLPAWKEAHCQIFFDKVQAVTLGTPDWDLDEA